MKSFPPVILLLAITFFPLFCNGQDNKESAEKQAYENAVDFLKESAKARIENRTNASYKSKEIQKLAQGPSDIIWDNNLEILALSHSQKGDKYLAQLAFFLVDGAGGEDFGCAIWHRGKTHKKILLKHLKQARDNYEKASPCLTHEFEEKKDYLLLQCITKEQYSKLIQMYEEPESKEGAVEGEANCSHMFKPTTEKIP